jgi:CrcB protein
MCAIVRRLAAPRTAAAVAAHRVPRYTGAVLRLLLVCAGGALGSGARYLVSTWAARALGADFPRGTLIVNATGSFVLAVIFTIPGSRISPELRLFLGAGVLGGYTTYSSFNTETLALIDQGSAALAVVNVGLTTAGCLVAGLLGLAVGRLVAS